jgi:outer membrane protein assembly factor BamB
VAGERVIVMAGEAVVAFDAADGSASWQVDREPGPTGYPVAAGDVVVFGEGEGDGAALVAVSLAEGNEAWRSELDDPVAGGLIAAGGRILVGTRGGEVLAFDAGTGEATWSAPVPGRIETAPAVAGGLVLVVAENLSNGRATVLGLEAEDGDEAWRLAPETASVGASSVSSDGEVAYVGLGDARVHALDVATGAERWSERLRSFFPSRSAPVVTEDALLVGDAPGHVFALDRSTGEERWVFRLPGILLRASPVVAGGYAVIGDETGQVSALDVASGLLAWKATLPGGAVGPPAPAGDRMYLTSRGEGGVVAAFEHDPVGRLLAEPSPTTLFPLRALVNFAVALVAVLVVLLALFRFGLGGGRVKRPGPELPASSEERP